MQKNYTRKREKIQDPKGEGYKGHRVGSRKEKAHELFDSVGAEQATPIVLASGLKISTVRSWFATWRKAGDRS